MLLILLYILFIPLFGYAKTIKEIIDYTTTNAIQPFISFLMVLATIVFIWGVIEFIAGAENETKRINGKKHIMWGLLGLFIMMAVAGLMWVILNFWTSVK